MCVTTGSGCARRLRSESGIWATGGCVGFETVDWFNGGLFDDSTALLLEKSDIDRGGTGTYGSRQVQRRADEATERGRASVAGIARTFMPYFAWLLQETVQECPCRANL